MDVLLHIKRLVVARGVEFTLKAEQERLADGLSRPREPLYVIESPNYSGMWIYTKGTIRRKGKQEVFYVFISSKLAT